jgi:CheY-like chemotaxis protein
MPHIETGNGETILVVDDHEAVLKCVVTILKVAHFHVLAATDGASAIKVSNDTAERIDLLLADVHMPLMSGPGLGQELKTTRPEIYWFSTMGGLSLRSPLCRRSWSI